MSSDASSTEEHLSENVLSTEFVYANNNKLFKRYEEHELYCRLCEVHLKSENEASKHIKGKEHKLFKQRFRDRQFCLKLWIEKPPPMYFETTQLISLTEEGVVRRVQEFYELFPLPEIESKLKSFKSYVKGYEINFHLFGSYCIGLMTNDNPIIDSYVCIKKKDGSELTMSEKLHVFDQLPFIDYTKHETVFSGFLCKLKFKKFSINLFCTLDPKAVNAVSSSQLLSLYNNSFPAIKNLSLIFRLWAKRMKFFAKSPDSHVSGSIFDYMVIYYLQKHYEIPVIEESRIGCPLPEFLQKDLKEQTRVVQELFEPLLASFSSISVASLFTNLILFYGCAFNYSHYIQITSSEPILKETGGFRSIKILDPISETNVNIFVMNLEHLVYLDNLLFYGLWDILQPLNDKGRPMGIMDENIGTCNNYRYPVLVFETSIVFDSHLSCALLDLDFLNGVGIWNPDSIRRPIVYCRFCCKPDHTTRTCNQLKLFDVNRRIILGVDKKLTSAIESYYSTERINNHHMEEAQGFFEWVEKIVKRESSYDIKLEPFGSLISGFGTKGSDFDLCVKHQNDECFTTEDGITALIKIGEALASDKRFKIKYTLTARVPVVTFNFVDSVFPCKGDISFSNKLALLNSKLMKTYAYFDKRVAPLVIAVKKWANNCDINSAVYNTFSSYALSVMVIHFLQRIEPPVLPYLQHKRRFNLDVKLVDGFEVQFEVPSPAFINKFCKNRASLGELFIQFIDYFNEFNWEDNVIQIRDEKDLDKYEKEWNRSPIAIEDPFELTHNLGGGIRDKSYYIKKCFNITRNEFRNSLSLFLKKGFNFKSDGLKKLMPRRKVYCLKCGNKGHYAGKCIN